jgi:hypothetical protein
MKDKYIVLEFSGWAKIEPERAMFVSLKNDNEDYIDGKAWLALDEDERSLYILEDAIQFQRDALDGEYTSLDVFMWDQ